jgi:hypothetical protein
VDGEPQRKFFRKMVMDGKLIGHINGDKLDCRRVNLKILEQSVNSSVDYIDKIIDIPVLEIKTIGKWMGGKPSGCISRTKYAYLVRFQTPKLHKSFNHVSYGSESNSLQAAKQFCYEEADRREIVKNKYRMVQTSDGLTFLEVQLPNKKTFYCDIEDKNIVEKAIWSYKSSSDTLYYVRHTETTDLPNECFHKLVVDYEVVDHINGNTLDNRKCNLRDGSRATNARNAKKRCDNISGITGVSFTKGAWIVQWPQDGKRMSKRFSKTAYGSLENAKAAAITFRYEKNILLNLHPRQNSLIMRE